MPGPAHASRGLAGKALTAERGHYSPRAPCAPISNRPQAPDRTRRVYVALTNADSTVRMTTVDASTSPPSDSADDDRSGATRPYAQWGYVSLRHCDFCNLLAQESGRRPSRRLSLAGRRHFASRAMSRANRLPTIGQASRTVLGRAPPLSWSDPLVHLVGRAASPCLRSVVVMRVMAQCRLGPGPPQAPLRHGLALPRFPTAIARFGDVHCADHSGWPGWRGPMR